MTFRNKKRNKIGSFILSFIIVTCFILSNLTGMITLPLDNTYALTPGTKDYYDEKWEEAKIKAGNMPAGTPYTNYQNASMVTIVEGPWKLDLDWGGNCSDPWNGLSTVPTETVTIKDYAGGSVAARKVYTAEQLRYCMVNSVSFQLQKDIDLAGYTGRTWSIPKSSYNSAAFAADGKGHTIYNYYDTGASQSSLFSNNSTNANSLVCNFRISNSYINDNTNSAGLFFSESNSYTPNAQNCVVENSMVKSRDNYPDSDNNTIYITAFSHGAKTIINCYTKNVHVYNSGKDDGSLRAHASGFVIPYSAATQNISISNCFAVDGTVISNGGHSGGFISCWNQSAGTSLTVTNCFTNVNVYGDKQTGAFMGIGSPVTNASIKFKNCYTSGKIEGTDTLGGFIADNILLTDTGTTTFEDCYSTSMVGMYSDADNVGGFAGKKTAPASQKWVFNRCYAAGEVGSLDVDSASDRTTSTTVGGFMGTHSSGSMSYTDCYYDKQTTAMREWATGISKNQTGITGLLTSDTIKSGAGLTGTTAKSGLSSENGWELQDGLYPQLLAFTTPANFTCYYWMKGETTTEKQANLYNLIKAYSQASVSTVYLETWEKDHDNNVLPATTYDTVRDLTLDFDLSSNNGTGNTVVTLYDDIVYPTASASSVYENAYSYSEIKAIDGSTNLCWGSSASEVKPWLQVDLGRVQPVENIKITWATSGSRWATEYKIQLSDDGTTWTDANTKTGNTGGLNTIALPAGTTARYVRMQTETKASSSVRIEIFDFVVDGMIRATSSTSYSTSYRPIYAIDRDNTTEWRSTTSDALPRWQIDLGSVQPVDRIKITWPSTTNRAAVYKIQLSVDGSNWTQAYRYIGNTGGRNIIDIPGASARYVRMETETRAATGVWLGFYEFEISYISSTLNFPYDVSTKWEKDGAVTELFEESADVLNLVKNSNGSEKWFANIIAPGIEWVTVNCKVGDQTGSRRLRIIPTASLDGGNDKELESGDKYDHADDVRLAYSTGFRMNQAYKDWEKMGYGITTGVFPDMPLNAYQEASQIPEGNLSNTPPGSNPPLTGQRLIDFEKGNDLFYQVDVSHLSKNGNDYANASKIYVSIHEIDSISETGEITLGEEVPVDNTKSDNPNNDLFNGISTFTAEPGTQYLIKYIWTLGDGRYLEKSKIIKIRIPPDPPTASKTASVNDGGLNPGTSETPVQVDIGDVIEYTIAVNNPESGEAHTDVTVTDILPKGLKYNDSSDSGVNTITEDGRDVVTWSISELPTNTTILLTVKATVTGIGLYINQATVDIEDYDEIKTNKTYHTVGTIKAVFEFIKVDAVMDNPLPGAVFNLYIWRGEGGAPDNLVPADLTGTGWELAGTCTSDDETGLVVFMDLIAGEYRLVEIEAPEGYQLPFGQWKFTVDNGSNSIPTYTGDNAPPAFKGEGTEDNPYLLGNIEQYKLPVTGGGAFWFTVLGSLMLVTGVILTTILFHYNNKKVS